VNISSLTENYHIAEFAVQKGVRSKKRRLYEICVKNFSYLFDRSFSLDFLDDDYTNTQQISELPTQSEEDSELPEGFSSPVFKTPFLPTQTANLKSNEFPSFSKQVESPFTRHENIDWSAMIGSKTETQKQGTTTASEHPEASEYKHQVVVICEGKGNARYEMG